MTDDELCGLTATAALDAFRRHELSPVELLSAIERRMTRVESSLNAISVPTLERGYAAAHASERRYQSGNDVRPLDGIPVLIKHLEPVVGEPADMASLLLKGQVATETSPIAQTVLDSGAVVHGRSASPEFGVASFTHSRIYGITRNPWNLDYGPGGSSGGAAAALAARTTLLATGSDGAGSIRMPASFCGVVGYKPPRGSIPLSREESAHSFSAAGPMARTVADCALFYDVLSGKRLDAVQDQTWAARVRELTIGVSANAGGFPVEPAIMHLIEESGRAANPTTMRPVDVPWVWSDVLAAGQGYLDRSDGVGLAESATGREHELCDYTLRQVLNARASKPEDLIACHEYRARMLPQVDQLFKQIDVLLCPTLGVNGFEAGDGYFDHGPVIDGTEVQYPFHTHIAMTFNLFNEYAALTVPCGFSAIRIPVGVQIVAPAEHEQAVFDVAMAIESTIGAEVVTRRPPDA